MNNKNDSVVPTLCALGLALSACTGMGLWVGLGQSADNRYLELGLTRAHTAVLLDALEAILKAGLIPVLGAGLITFVFLALPKGWSYGLLRAAVVAACFYAVAVNTRALERPLVLIGTDWLREIWIWFTVAGASAISGTALTWEHPKLRLRVCMAFAAFPALVWGGLYGGDMFLTRRAYAARPGAPNVLYLVVDALRPDHMSGFGYDKDTSPFMDSLAREGVVFHQAWVQGNATRMSVPSYFASVYPPAHGVTRRNQGADPALLMLAEVLKNQGYDTAAWMPNPSLGKQYRFYDGFDSYFDMGAILSNAYAHGLPKHKQWETAQTIHRLALEWLDQQRESGAPYFMYFHYRDVHGPYVPPPPYDTMFLPAPSTIPRPLPDSFTMENNTSHYLLPDERYHELNFLVSQYDGEIRYTDDQMKYFFEAMKSKGFLKNTIVILSADHGESFLEHGVLNHGFTLFEEVIHVPLVFWGPGIEPRGVEAMVQSLDVAPTLLDLLEIKVPDSFQGHSLRPWFEGKTGPARDEILCFGTDRTAMLRTREWKFIRYLNKKKADHLYHLESDPEELYNLIAPRRNPTPEHLEKARRMRVRLEERIAESLERGFASSSFFIDPKLDNELKSLGYLQ